MVCLFQEEGNVEKSGDTTSAKIGYFAKGDIVLVILHSCIHPTIIRESQAGQAHIGKIGINYRIFIFLLYFNSCTWFLSSFNSKITTFVLHKILISRIKNR